MPFQILRRKGRGGWWQRLGNFSLPLQEALRGNHPIWVHAVSVGEVLAVRGLISRIQSRFPQEKIVLSTVTPAGFGVAQQMKNDRLIVIFAPVDLSLVVRRFIDLINPKLYLATETEIWPSLFCVLQRREIPIILVNGRISDRSYQGYQKIRSFIKRILAGVTNFCMQSEADAERIIELGARPERVMTAGNLKFDESYQDVSADDPRFRLFRESLVWIAGSTHPGEEEILLKVLSSLSQRFPQLRLVIAPRHRERSRDITRIAGQFGFHPVLWTQMGPGDLPSQTVVIIDTIGQLRFLYALADVVFVGKSFKVGGGQNIIEPAFYGKPMIVGPLMQNFKNITDIFLKEKAMIQVRDTGSFHQQMIRLLEDPALRKQMGENARLVIRNYQGATDRTLNVIVQNLSR